MFHCAPPGSRTLSKSAKNGICRHKHLRGSRGGLRELPEITGIAPWLCPTHLVMCWPSPRSPTQAGSLGHPLLPPPRLSSPPLCKSEDENNQCDNEKNPHNRPQQATTHTITPSSGEVLCRIDVPSVVPYAVYWRTSSAFDACYGMELLPPPFGPKKEPVDPVEIASTTETLQVSLASQEHASPCVLTIVAHCFHRCQHRTKSSSLPTARTAAAASSATPIRLDRIL